MSEEEGGEREREREAHPVMVICWSVCEILCFHCYEGTRRGPLEIPHQTTPNCPPVLVVDPECPHLLQNRSD